MLINQAKFQLQQSTRIFRTPAAEAAGCLTHISGRINTITAYPHRVGIVSISHLFNLAFDGLDWLIPIQWGYLWFERLRFSYPGRSPYLRGIRFELPQNPINCAVYPRPYGEYYSRLPNCENISG